MRQKFLLLGAFLLPVLFTQCSKTTSSNTKCYIPTYTNFYGTSVQMNNPIQLFTNNTTITDTAVTNRFIKRFPAYFATVGHTIANDDTLMFTALDTVLLYNAKFGKIRSNSSCNKATTITFVSVDTLAFGPYSGPSIYDTSQLFPNYAATVVPLYSSAPIQFYNVGHIIQTGKMDSNIIYMPAVSVFNFTRDTTLSDSGSYTIMRVYDSLIVGLHPMVPAGDTIVVQQGQEMYLRH
jgi:hypothetical protein